MQQLLDFSQVNLALPALRFGRDMAWVYDERRYLECGALGRLKDITKDLPSTLIDSQGGHWAIREAKRGKTLRPFWKPPFFLTTVEFQLNLSVEPSLTIEQLRALLLEKAKTKDYHARTRRFLRHVASAESFAEFSALVMDERYWS